MRRVWLRFLVAALVCLGGAAAGGYRIDAQSQGRPALSCWQYGIPTPGIIAGDPFQVRGSEFVGSLPVQVCFSGEQCLHSEVDSTGAFVQNRILRTAGTYLVTVRQARSRDLDRWLLRATLQVQVTK
jgi:hypothetical protein